MALALVLLCLQSEDGHPASTPPPIPVHAHAISYCFLYTDCIMSCLSFYFTFCYLTGEMIYIYDLPIRLSQPASCLLQFHTTVDLFNVFGYRDDSE